MSRQACLDVSRKSGEARSLSIFVDGLVDHPNTSAVSARWLRPPNPFVSLAILIGGLAAMMGIAAALAAVNAPLTAVAVTSMVIGIIVFSWAFLRIHLQRVQRWGNWKVVVRERDGRREIGRAWTVVPGVLIFQPAPSADELTVWVPDELEIPSAEIEQVTIAPAPVSGHLITVNRRSQPPVQYRTTDAAAPAVLGQVLQIPVDYVTRQ